MQKAKYKIDLAPRRSYYSYGVYEKRWWGWQHIHSTDHRDMAKNYIHRLLTDTDGLPEYFY